MMRSMIVTTRRDCAMWWMKPTRVPMLTSPRTSVRLTPSPGTKPSSPPRTSRRVRRAKTNVPTKTASADWVHRSRSNELSTRGLNWLDASWSATIVIVNVNAAKVSTDEATVLRIARAESGPPPYSRPNCHRRHDPSRRL